MMIYLLVIIAKLIKLTMRNTDVLYLDDENDDEHGS